MSLICTPDSKTRPCPLPSLPRRVEKCDSAPILTAQPDSGMLWSMKTLLQVGLQVHMPATPEKRLLINRSREGFEWLPGRRTRR